MQTSISKNIFDDYLIIKTSSTFEDKENKYSIGFSKDESPCSNELEINTSSNKRTHEEPDGVSNNLRRRIRKKYGGGFDQRELGKTCLEKIYDQVQEKTTLDKLRKYNYQMNLLKKLENNKNSEFEKIKAIEEYNYVMESLKYAHNFESGGLYSDWNF
jgi:hypothetical protein